MSRRVSFHPRSRPPLRRWRSVKFVGLVLDAADEARQSLHVGTLEALPFFSHNTRNQTWH